MRKDIVIILLLIALAGVGLIVWGAYRLGLERAPVPISDASDVKPVPPAPTPSQEPEILAYKDVLVIYDLQPNDEIRSPLVIKGKARGTWFFEATFPIALRGNEGQVMAQTYATADGEWMTEDFVPFTATVTFNQPTGGSGMLIFEKDNPSGLPENADEFRVKVNF